MTEPRRSARLASRSPGRSRHDADVETPSGRGSGSGSAPAGDDDDGEGLEGDYLNLLLLLLLYTLQGVPMGLAGAIPYILAEKGTSYAAQAEFSLVSWPFSLKLFCESSSGLPAPAISPRV